MDTGDIISYKGCDILPEDNIGTLHDKLSLLGKDLLKETLPKIIEGTNDRIKQDDSKATYTKLIKREDELLDFNKDGKSIINKIRAFNPWPLAYFVYDQNEIKVIEAKFIPDNNSVVNKVIINKKEMLIGCKDGYISLLKVKPQGKKIMDISSYLNGIKSKGDDYIG